VKLNDLYRNFGIIQSKSGLTGSKTFALFRIGVFHFAWRLFAKVSVFNLEIARKLCCNKV